jgi:hypothetical protein
MLLFLGDDLALAGIGRAHIDPLHEVGDDLLGQLGQVRRHPCRAVVLQNLDQQTFLRLAERQHRPAVTPLEHAGLAVEQQITPQLLRLSRVAGVAVLAEDRPNLAFKELNALRIEPTSKQARRQQEQSDPEDKHFQVHHGFALVARKAEARWQERYHSTASAELAREKPTA